MKTNLQSSKPQRIMASAQLGFTLIEAMIALAVVAVLLAVGMPQLSGFTAGRAVQSHVSSLATTMRLARTEAVKRSTRVTVCPSANPEAAVPACAGNTTWQTGWLMFTDRGAAGTVDGTDQVIRVQPAMTNSGGISSTGGGAVSFFPTGISVGGQRTFTFVSLVDISTDNGKAIAKIMCQSSVGSTRVIKYTEAC